MSNHNGDDTSREGDASLDEKEAARLTAYALGQLQGEELAAVERKLSAGGAGQREVHEVKSLATALSAARFSNESDKRSDELRKALLDRLNGAESATTGDRKAARASLAKQSRRLPIAELLAIGGVALVLIALLLPAGQVARESARRAQSSNDLHNLSLPSEKYHDTIAEQPYDMVVIEQEKLAASLEQEKLAAAREYGGRFQGSVQDGEKQSAGQSPGIYQRMMSRNDKLPSVQLQGPDSIGGQAAEDRGSGRENATAANARSTRGSRVANKGLKQVPNMFGDLVPSNDAAIGAAAQAQAANDAEVEVAKAAIAVAKAELDAGAEIRRNDPRALSLSQLRKDQFNYEKSLAQERQAVRSRTIRALGDRSDGGEQYEPIYENAFLSPLQQPLSTFSIDVDTASYANMRRFLTSGRLPPRNSVRIEELVNYFRYDYKQPGREMADETPAPRGEPFSVNMEVAECPWTLTPALSQGEREGRRGHLLLRVGLKGKEVQRSERPQGNLVFLLDVSGSMSDENKLPLLKTAMKLLVGELGENDRVTIVTYAGEAGLRLPPTRGHEQAKINRVIESLSAGGSTNGSAGIHLAYEQAAAYFVPGGTNRVILCTDGDLNVGVTSDEALVKLIKQKAAGGVFLTVLGFGEGNLKDAKMEKLADNGNGLYAYIDSVREAKKVLVEQLTGSTITIAKDVKIQIEFNPAQIAAYRLLGYENRVLAAEDFNNDKKDAGEIGAGHTVTALYELVPVGAADEAGQSRPGTDALKYQGTVNGGVGAAAVGGFSGGEGVGGGFGGAVGNALSGVPRGGVQESGKLTDAAKSGELLTLKLRYKEPEGETSKLMEYPLKDRGHSFHSASPDMQFAAAVASFGMILRGSEHRGSSNLAAVAEIASASLGTDAGGYRAEFVDLVRKAQALGARP